MDKKQIDFLRKIYNRPMKVETLRRRCGIDIKTYHLEYRTLEMSDCFEVYDISKDFEGTAHITPKGREAVERYDRDFRDEARAEKAIKQSSIAIGASIVAVLISLASLIAQFI